MKILLLLLLFSGNIYAKLTIQHWVTPEGAKVLFVKTQGLPMLDIALNFDAASSRDGDQYGLATLTNSLLGTATQHHSEEQIINTFESLGAQFSQYSLKDMSIVSLRTLSTELVLNKALNVFTEVVSQPSFQQHYLSREKRQTLQLIKAKQQSPASVASQAFAKSVFATHPYAHSKIGTATTIKNIRLTDVKRHYQQFFVAKNLTIALVGDVSRVKAKQIARQLSHGLNMGKKARPNPLVKPLKQARKIHLDFPSKQTHLLIGQVGINRAHPDYYALYLGNHIFGGSGLVSILSEEIREKKGLAYSAYSYFSQMTSNGYFLLELQTKNAQAKEAEMTALTTLKNFVNQIVSPQQLQDAKDNIIGGFALKTASNADILTYLSIIGFYNLPLDFLSSFTDKIKHISAQDVQHSFKRLINIDKLLTLSVGANQ